MADMNEGLRKAAGDGDAIACAAMLAGGADPSSKDPSGDSAVHRAAGGGHDAALAVLLDAGGSADARGACGETPMHRAAQILSADCIHRLAAAGGNPMAQNDLGDTPAHMIAKCPVQNPVPAMEALLRRLPPGWALTPNGKGETPADVAVAPAIRSLINGVVEAEREEAEILSAIAPLRGADGGGPGRI